MTLSYDEDLLGDSNRTLLSDNYFGESVYSETMSEESDPFNESFNDVMDLKNNLTLSDGNEDDEFEEMESEENEDDENLLTNGTESRLQVSLAFNSGPPVTEWTTRPANGPKSATDKISNFSNSFDLIKSINLISSIRAPNGNHANGNNGNHHGNRPTSPNGNQFTKSFFSAKTPAGVPRDVKQQVRSKRQCRHNRKYNGKRRWPNGRDRPNRRTYPYQYDHLKDAPDDEERKWELIERKRGRV